MYASNGRIYARENQPTFSDVGVLITIAQLNGLMDTS